MSRCFPLLSGLKGTSVVHLRELFDAESISLTEGSKPKAESDLAQAALRHVLAVCPVDELKLVVGRRDLDVDFPADTAEPLLEKDGFDLIIDDLVDAELASEVPRCKEKHLKQRVAKEAKHVKATQLGSASSSSGAVQEESQRKVADGGEEVLPADVLFDKGHD